MAGLDVVQESRAALLTEGRGSSSHARILDDWYVVCTSEELDKASKTVGIGPLATKPKGLAVRLFGTPLVVFRTGWGVGALLDRCPHRNAPLSAGFVQGDELVCGYHGWSFDRTGKCRNIPCLVGDVGARRVPSFAARELDGHVWVYATPDAEPVREPFRFPGADDKRFTTVTAQLDVAGTVHASAENALDVPHTAYLHGGLFRDPNRELQIDVVIKREAEMCEAEYIGEPRPDGVVGRLLAPGGGVVTHFDRFHLPCITQVEYRLGDDSHLWIHAALTPLDEGTVRLFGVASFRIPFKLPGRLVGKALRPLGLVILGQDAKMLKLQAEAFRRFGGEHLTSTEVDCLGPHILKLLKDAEGGRRGKSAPFERRIRMKI